MKKYRGIRYQFRPENYWQEENPLGAILRNVTGENRRQLITHHWEHNTLDQLDPSLLTDELAPEVRTFLGSIHPSLLGGEFLPEYLPLEVEIARITLDSTTADVVSLRARPAPEGIAYRMVDEYNGKFTLPIRRSARPLTLAELITQFEQGRLDELGGTLDTGYNWYNLMELLEDESFDPETLRYFTTISSSIYPQLYNHFHTFYSRQKL
jgi:hypothetical protein